MFLYVAILNMTLGHSVQTCCAYAIGDICSCIYASEDIERYLPETSAQKKQLSPRLNNTIVKYAQVSSA